MNLAPFLPHSEPPPRRVTRPLLLFLISLAACTMLAAAVISYRQNMQHNVMERLLTEKIHLITSVIGKLLHKTEALKALVVQANGDIADFHNVALAIMDDPAIVNVFVAPGGVVSHVYPLVGNERLIGCDLYSSGECTMEDLMARKQDWLTFEGPSSLMQDDLELVGRLPVFIARDGEKTALWGLVSVTLKYPDALEGANLKAIEHGGFGYEIWRINPADNQRQIIASSTDNGSRFAGHIERSFQILNAEWAFRIMPMRAWYEETSHLLMLFLTLCASSLAWAFARSRERLVHVRCDLACLLHKDALTGVLNRRGILHVLKALIANGAPFRLYYLDLNHFKWINDTFGHNEGDRALVIFCRRFERHLTANHALARMSGDEFILVHAPALPIDAEKDGWEQNFWEQVNREMDHPLISDSGASFQLSFSIGKAVFPEDGLAISALICQADISMYEQKRASYAKDLKRRYSDGG